MKEIINEAEQIKIKNNAHYIVNMVLHTATHLCQAKSLTATMQTGFWKHGKKQTQFA
jgi:hypothetical protein